MNTFIHHNIESAPSKAKLLLEQAYKDYGMVPGLYQVMASSPELLQSYFTLHEQFENTDLSTTEKNVVWLAINVEHECHYCVPAHTAIAKMQGVDDKIIEALRNNNPLDDSRLETLRSFTLSLVRHRGNAPQSDIEEFLSAGYQPRHVLDILVGVAQKVLSNYTNHLAQTPVDDMFTPFVWTPPSKQ